MTTIGLRQAEALSELMKRESAHNASTETITIHGVEATVVILDHVDREDDEWQSVHVLGYVSGSVGIGNVPKGPQPTRPDTGRERKM